MLCQRHLLLAVFHIIYDRSVSKFENRNLYCWHIGSARAPRIAHCHPPVVMPFKLSKWTWLISFNDCSLSLSLLSKHWALWLRCIFMYILSLVVFIISGRERQEMKPVRQTETCLPCMSTSIMNQEAMCNFYLSVCLSLCLPACLSASFKASVRLGWDADICLPCNQIKVLVLCVIYACLFKGMLKSHSAAMPTRLFVSLSPLPLWICQHLTGAANSLKLTLKLYRLQTGQKTHIFLSFLWWTPIHFCTLCKNPLP